MKAGMCVHVGVVSVCMYVLPVFHVRIVCVVL